jgi:polyhydroxyalkanoate synthesis repressor PhaR
LTPSPAEHDPIDPPSEPPRSTAAEDSDVQSSAVSNSGSNSGDSDFGDHERSSEPVTAPYTGAPHTGAPYTGAPHTGAEADAANSPVDEDAAPADETRRTIKRYSNRKLYDTRQSRYVTLLQIAEMVRAGEDVQIIDNASKEDKTDVTLALIISEELKARPRAIPLATLKALIRHRGGKLLTQLRESPIGRLMPRDEGAVVDHDLVAEPQLQDAPTNAEDSHVSKEQPGGLRKTLEQWQHTIDDRIRAVVPHFSTIQELQGEVQQLSKRIEELEKRLAAPRE